ncbi:MAG TPA: polysaccharide pyruvyl transferase CsaB, partial [Candidatus Aquilonibacter sp.]
MRVLLSGYYGFGNLGDEALLEVIVEQMRARFPSVTIDVLSATPEVTARTYGVDATPRWSMRAVREAIGRADVVLSGGGGLLQTATSARSIVYYAGILREAIHQRRKAMIFAQSIGPLDVLGRIIVRNFCRGTNRATVRDMRSVRLLQTLLPQTLVEQTADPVFLYDLPVGEVDLRAEGLGDQPYAIVSVRKVSSLKDGQHAIARAVDRLAQTHGVRVAFLPLGGVSDAEISTAIIRLCKSAPMLLPECSLERAAAMLRGAYVVIGMRLHALILAARFAVPFLAIPYDPKVAALCDDLAYPLDPLWTPGKPVPSGPV